MNTTYKSTFFCCDFPGKIDIDLCLSASNAKAFYFITLIEINFVFAQQQTTIMTILVHALIKFIERILLT